MELFRPALLILVLTQPVVDLAKLKLYKFYGLCAIMHNFISKLNLISKNEGNLIRRQTWLNILYFFVFA